MSLEDLAGMFAGDPSYSTDPEPEPEPELFSGGVLDSISAVGIPIGSTIMMTARNGMSSYMAAMQKLTRGVGRAIGGHFDVVVFDEAQAYVVEDNNWNAEKAARQRKDRGQKFPGTGWGKRK